MLLLIETGGEELLLFTDDHSTTVLHQAVMQGQVEVVQLLIGAGRQRLLFLTDKNCHTPLHTATCLGHINLSRLLVKMAPHCEGHRLHHS